MKNAAKVVVGLPSGDSVTTDFALSLARMMSFEKNRVLGIINERASVTEGRQRIVEKALGYEGLTHVLFLDSDISFPENVVEYFLHRGAEVIGADYNRRRPPFIPVANAPEGRFVEAEFIGLGCALISLDVFRKMETPYFDIGWENGNYVSEDVALCRALKAKGVKIFCDRGLTIRHIGQGAV